METVNKQQARSMWIVIIRSSTWVHIFDPLSNKLQNVLSEIRDLSPTSRKFVC